MRLTDLLEKKGADALTVAAATSVAEAIRIMNRHHVGSVVVTATDGALQGILTERDVLRLFAEARGDFEKLTVGECMTTQLKVGHPDDRVDDVLALMTSKRFRHIPVIQGKAIVGVLSIGDLVKAKLDETADEARALRDYINS